MRRRGRWVLLAEALGESSIKQLKRPDKGDKIDHPKLLVVVVLVVVDSEL